MRKILTGKSWSHLAGVDACLERMHKENKRKDIVTEKDAEFLSAMNRLGILDIHLEAERFGAHPETLRRAIRRCEG